MVSIAFALPIAAGKKGADSRKFIEALLDDKSSHFNERLKRRGYRRVKVFHQTWPSEQFVIYAESGDLHGTLKGKDADGDFETWFREQWEALTGHHVSNVAPHISELVMDWHPERGGSRTHHR